jgi:serine/threonine-protein kinase
LAETLEPLKAALADRYTLERELGRGGMATVYRAQDLHHVADLWKTADPELQPYVAEARGCLEHLMAEHP